MIKNLLGFDKDTQRAKFRVLEFNNTELNKRFYNKEIVSSLLEEYRKNLAGKPFLHIYNEEKDYESEHYNCENDCSAYWFGFLVDYEITEEYLDCTFKLFPKGYIYTMFKDDNAYEVSFEILCVGCDLSSALDIKPIGFPVHDLAYLQRRQAAYERKIKNGQKPKREYE